MKNQLYINKKDCCGCEACANACPIGIIKMTPDQEGFFYPQITNEDKCINCMKCQEVCPIKNTKSVESFCEHGYGGYFKDDNEVKSSASGGLATAISRASIKTGANVYGVKYNEDCSEVLFGRAEDYEELEKFKTSKYVQARKYDVYSKISADLKAGRKVLFIGLPCECYALQLYLGKSYERLYSCALICHGPTSQAVHLQYCEMIKLKHNGMINQFSVRYKKEGWKPYYIRAIFEDGYEHLEKFVDSYYGMAFIYMKRPSCSVCKIKREKIHADIIIGDYHLAFSGNVKPYNPNGVSSAIVVSEKGQELLERLNDFLIESVPIKNILYNVAYSKSIHARRNRSEFGSVFSSAGLKEACNIKSISSIEREIKIKSELKRKCVKIKKLIIGN